MIFFKPNRAIGAPDYSAAVALVAATMALPVYAQSETSAIRHAMLEEVVVTAQRRSENLQDVPISVSAIVASDLRNSGMEATKDLPQLIPSVQFTRSGTSGLFFVRGVGTTNGAVGEEGANAFYVDNVYMGDLAGTINYFNNVERVEVLKGPQGTLFGRNATGGLVHVITREPGAEEVLDVELGYGNYDTFNGRIYAATPLSDTVSVDIALTGLSQGEGWGRNVNLVSDQ